MDTPIELKISDVENISDGKIIQFIGDLDATNVELALKQITELFESGYIKIIADFFIDLLFGHITLAGRQLFDLGNESFARLGLHSASPFKTTSCRPESIRKRAANVCISFKLLFISSGGPSVILRRITSFSS